MDTVPSLFQLYRLVRARVKSARAVDEAKENAAFWNAEAVNRGAVAEQARRDLKNAIADLL